VKFETFFRLSSYSTLAAGLLALAAAGGIGAWLALALLAALGAAWATEGTRWRLSERKGLALVLLAIPLFWADWKLQGAGWWGATPARSAVGALAHFIIYLSLVKLWQAKADRDWLFLYLISFFEVLLAAGLSMSPRFVATLALYVFCAVTTVVCFEMRRARRGVKPCETRVLYSPRAGVLGRVPVLGRERRERRGEAGRLLFASLLLLALIFALAVPLFFLTPRLGRGALARSEGGLTNLVGFSDEVSLGEYGRLQQSEQVVMRVRVEDPYAARNMYLRWRGVALDEFDGRTWRRSTNERVFQGRNAQSLFRFGTTESAERLTTQTFYVEPLDTPVLFAAARAVAVQGALPFVGRDAEGALTTREHPRERITYRVYSDTSTPPLERLRRDNGPYTRAAAARYLQLPANLDPRIPELARGLITGTGADNRYDAAQVFEQYFRQNFKYSLDMTAGGPDPLADFMFRVRAGHCEYYSTAMAVMLRSVGIGARVVNGFQMGDYNDAADVFTVRQSDAHSWVEVDFPATDAWLTFDPTPPGARGGAGAGPRSVMAKYAEALEMFWIQYVVDYDRQEQRQLASSLRGQLVEYQRGGFRLFEDLSAGLSAWWAGARVPGAANAPTPAAVVRATPIIFLAALLGLALVARRRVAGLWRKLAGRRGRGAGRSPVRFYERMTRALEARGLRRAPEQTPLEFASALDAPEALLLTRAYNRVRFGAHALTPDESRRVEEWLRKIENKD
jgi:protein-glutamine gamma-glutamyltransferase